MKQFDDFNKIIPFTDYDIDSTFQHRRFCNELWTDRKLESTATFIDEPALGRSFESFLFVVGCATEVMEVDDFALQVEHVGEQVSFGFLVHLLAKLEKVLLAERFKFGQKFDLIGGNLLWSFLIRFFSLLSFQL